MPKEVRNWASVDDVIVRIRRAVESGAFDETREHGYLLHAGDKVRIAEGNSSAWMV
ncbi:hypothetical protein [Mesorhizobium sp.]|uniref:hypothetical protein n=1 Tax=Mesorhizobium sp. TaxID=1871066 RepID=UPI00258AA842|nr:hypothetical protein [Mesorhizobium sp.]